MLCTTSSSHFRIRVWYYHDRYTPIFVRFFRSLLSNTLFLSLYTALATLRMCWIISAFSPPSLGHYSSKVVELINLFYFCSMDFDSAVLRSVNRYEFYFFRAGPHELSAWPNLLGPYELNIIKGSSSPHESKHHL